MIKIPDKYRVILQEFVCDTCDNDFYMADGIEKTHCPYPFCEGIANNNGEFTAYIRHKVDDSE